ncbi:MAG: hypothetical protein A2Y62_09855 [Candidatus Fischerbacteria bacterium RBG_13_37_8]|uniref:GIY-YIG domain-containing protein n=1 Tax=Candidatus Fischerbacteria bacterium RBG_13_37_8 TaxID=1817863 RepID=A0A1F5V5U9_9BACT|nr:MAG: hypothetical protein A2Y62_09855 [Candidatus Fischerbacteria bacterium RBG_13_37_8]
MRWKIYRLTNHTLREIYMGIAKDVELRKFQHSGLLSGGASTIAHWNWKRDDIRWYSYPGSYNLASKASQEAHNLEKYGNIPSGYSVFLTPGL